jgi:excisionase family DNA binding protein
VHRFARYLSNQNCDVLDSDAMDNFVLHSRTQYCPLCLKESGYHRIFWDLLPVTVCLKHEVILQSVCPTCKRTVTVNWVLRNKCECGEDLLLVDPVSITPYTEAVRYQFFIQSLLGINELNDLKIVSGIQNSPAVDLSTSDFFKVLKIFSTLILKKLPGSSRFLKLGSITAEPPDKIAIKNCTSSVTNFILINSAASILLDWPQKFYEFLEEYSTINRSERYDTGVQKYFGGFKESVLDKLDAEKFGFIHHAYAKYLNEHWTGGHLNDRIKVFDMPEGKKLQKKYISADEAIDILGGRDSSISKLIGQKIIQAVVLKAKSKKKYLIDAESVYALKKKRDGMLTYSDLADRLNIDPDRVRLLVKSGLLFPFKSPVIFKLVLFLREDVEKFEKEFLSEERYSVVDKKPEGYLPAIEAVKTVTHTKTNLVGLLQLVSQGVFNPIICTEEKGLSRLLLSKNELKKYRDEYFDKKRDNERLSIYQASVIIGLDMRLLQHLINVGLITTSVNNSEGKQTICIQKKDLDEFKSQYSFIEEAAALMGFNTETIFKWIKEGRLNDYSGIPITRRTSIRILRRKEIKSFMPENSMDVPQAAECLGLSSEYVHTLIRKNMLTTLKGKGLGRTPFHRIPRQEIVRYKENLLKPTRENYMGVGQAAKYLGVGRSTIYRLRDKKILSTTKNKWKQTTLIHLQELVSYKKACSHEI